MRSNRRANKPIYTHEGAPAKHINPEQQLRRLVCACLLGEDQFYIDGRTAAEQISDAAKIVPPATVRQIALDARARLHLRHAPLWLVNSMLPMGGRLTGDTVRDVIHRADEMGELLAMYWGAGRKPMSAQLKRGLREAFGKFDKYQLSKYARQSSVEVRLRDVMFMTHPKPPEGMGEVYKAIAADELTTADADTWEANMMQLPADGVSKEQHKLNIWTKQLESGKLGYMALLRNLRNMLAAGVDEELIKSAILARKGARRVLPFRFIAAAQAAPSLATELNKSLLKSVEEMPKMAGKTVIVVDVSASMQARLSDKSDLNRMQAAAALASVAPAESLRVFSFSNRLVECPNYAGLPGITAIKNSQPNHGTYLGACVRTINDSVPHDRLIVVTDEQSADRVPDPVVKRAYMINVGAYKNGVGYGAWRHVDGFSESIFRFINELELLDE
jgi:60 kDa SS-A/Ro ribonucleoprotein